MVELEDGYGLRFRQRRSNKVVVYDLASAPDAEGAAAGSDVAGFVDMLKKDRRCSQPVAMVKVQCTHHTRVCRREPPSRLCGPHHRVTPSAVLPVARQHHRA